MIELRNAAKINLYLDVRRRLESGYHEIETLYQPVGLYDEIRMEPARGRGITLEGNDSSIRWDESNLCHRAARCMLDWAGCRKGVRIVVEKRIPHGAGLGGGSGNAAAVLLGLDRLFGLGATEEELLTLGAGLGSDVPFFVKGVPAIGTGRGDRLEETAGLRSGWIVIVKPHATISTSWAYQNIKIGLTTKSDVYTLGHLIKGLERFPDVELATWNSFTEIVVGRHPEIGELIASMTAGGALLSSLSGSGSACFGIFSEEVNASEVEQAFIDKGLFSKIVRPVDQAVVQVHAE